MLSRLAPAKVNLFLHVGPVDADGYHPLESLVAFADVGDLITAEKDARLSLTVEGRFADELGATEDNLILKSLRRLGEVTGAGEPPIRVTLDKRLPIASGLGGGSADAGAALKLARDLLELDLDNAALAEIAAQIGADGPMCLHARPAWAGGRGERLDFEPNLPALPALLINPGLASPTGAVYRAFDLGRTSPAHRPGPPPAWEAPAVIDWLAGLRNDLEAPAVALEPGIEAALGEASGLPGVRLCRMSGSGATVFALFDNLKAAATAARGLQAKYPHWWTAPATLC